jgi:c(7)-type cytochrome triheme protein
MPYQTRIIAFLGLALICLSAPAPLYGAGTYFEIPEALSPERYGDVLINRLSEKKGEKAASFSHWSHRRRYTCRYCHFELEFNMKANTTEITEAENRAGRFCGACHDGKEHDGVTVFGHEQPHCERCHTGDLGSGSWAQFRELSRLPQDPYGNGVDWVKALEKGMIRPRHSRTAVPLETTFDKKLLLDAEWFNIPPAVFPHKQHVQWLDCNNCHPDIFNIKKKTTRHFLMVRILKGEFCGVCHLSVAFPMDDCKRCHPSLKK